MEAATVWNRGAMMNCNKVIKKRQALPEDGKKNPAAKLLVSVLSHFSLN
jgi:hypothetical protein